MEERQKQMGFNNRSGLHHYSAYSIRIVEVYDVDGIIDHLSPSSKPFRARKGHLFAETWYTFELKMIRTVGWKPVDFSTFVSCETLLAGTCKFLVNIEIRFLPVTALISFCFVFSLLESEINRCRRRKGNTPIVLLPYAIKCAAGTIEGGKYLFVASSSPAWFYNSNERFCKISFLKESAHLEERSISLVNHVLLLIR